ncbi:response regulator transcription factor [Isoptericola halotolerans]|uniref:DNA-binding response OmpR family regulator n=1 Tax=Isoptericola halotolerans TaxID=300560 RepID=A0ABX2A6P3_9MICO|nr:response regulator transcription factor [Isoptericola halotolerans]NOV98530.1 DNA-binding response OmpR family regulator [Isoptericola halotolerans]
MVRVLVVDDDTTVADVVVAYLERAGMTAEHVADGAQALAVAAARPPDAVVLDLMLPGLDGLEVCRRLRTDRPGLPVLMLTARGEEDDRVAGLEIGADDYVTKPFSPRELTLRVQSVLRRSGAVPAPEPVPHPAGPGDPPPVPPSGTLRDGDLTLDVAAHRLLRGGREVDLTAREFDLLTWFLARPGQVHDRETLLREVWGWEYGDRSTVTVHVRRLREKVEEDPSRPARLVTVFGVGYRWDARTGTGYSGAPGGPT